MSQFEFNDEAVAMLEFLRKITGCSSTKDVIRDAMSLYEDMVFRTYVGTKIYVGKSKEDLKEYVFEPLVKVGKNND